MLLVIMTRSLIGLGNTVRASLNDDCMTETDSDITRGYDSITRSYRRERESWS